MSTSNKSPTRRRRRKTSKNLSIRKNKLPDILDVLEEQYVCNFCNHEGDKNIFKIGHLFSEDLIVEEEYEDLDLLSQDPFDFLGVFCELCGHSATINMVLLNNLIFQYSTAGKWNDSLRFYFNNKEITFKQSD